MKKLLMISCIYMDDEHSGITRKVKSYYRALEKQYDTWLVAYQQGEIGIWHKGKVKTIPNKNPYKKAGLIAVVKKLIEEQDFDYVYIRRIPCNFYVMSLLKKIKQKRGVDSILWEIPTYPYDYEDHSRIEKIENYLDKKWRKHLKKYVDRIVTFSEDAFIFDIPCIRLENGIDVEAIPVREPGEKQPDEINLIAVAVLHDWHGYDRLLEGMGQYYKNRQQKKVYFHLIGDGPAKSQYEELIEKYGLQEYVKMYGYLSPQESAEIYNKCDIAVESLAWHRIHVKIGSTLKVREYLAKGMPIFASSPMDVVPKGWEYAAYAPIDDSPIEIDSVIAFYEKVYGQRTPEEVAEEIRCFAIKNCDINKTLKGIVDYWRNKYE